MVFVDELTARPKAPIACFRPGSCHMTADTLEELHAMAAKIGLRRDWFQAKSSAPHYDLTASKRARALEAGAVFKPGREQARERFTKRNAEQSK